MPGWSGTGTQDPWLSSVLVLELQVTGVCPPQWLNVLFLFLVTVEHLLDLNIGVYQYAY
jgi:hypothetical protein